MPAKFETFHDAELDIGVEAVPFNTSNVHPNKTANLSFYVIPTLAAGQTVTLDAFVNNDQVLWEQFTSEGTRVIQVNVDAGILDPVNPNTLTPIRPAGSGRSPSQTASCTTRPEAWIHH